MSVRAVKHGTVIGGNYSRAALWINGKELEIAFVNNWDEAVKWAKKAWRKRSSIIGEQELQRLGWTAPELRYWR